MADTGFSAAPHMTPPATVFTPHMDALAREGTTLRNYYTHPTCTPSRAALMTGRYAHNTGMPFPLIGKPLSGLPLDVPLLPELLHARGYSTHLVGKWHLGHSKHAFTPLARGYDTFFGLHGGGFDHYTKSIGVCVDLWEGTVHVDAINASEHATSLFTDRAVKIIRRHAAELPDAPLFLTLSYTAPHDPLQADPPYLSGACAGVPNLIRRRFCAMMAQLDDGIAHVTAALRESGRWDRTLLILTSDNGGMQYVGGSPFPLRGEKSMAWDGGVRVPAFVRAPPSWNWHSGDYNGLVHIADWLPTILSLVDQHSSNSTDTPVAAPAPTKLDGVDLSEALSTNGDSPRRAAVLQLDVFLNSSAYRSGCLKLVLGCAGDRMAFAESNTERLLAPADPSAEPAWVRAALLAEEYAFRLVEHVVQPPIDQFVKYVIALKMAQLRDVVEGTSHTHVLTRWQRNDIAVASLASMPPALERAQLFDVCVDPREDFNLARDPAHAADVERLFAEFSATWAHAPTQFAGDVVYESAPSTAGCGPWLSDDADVEAMLAAPGHPFIRTFDRLARFALVLTMGFVVAVATAVCVPCVCLCICCRRRAHSKKVKTS
eukprot:TRINITY_DN236_c1_g1_i1.p1 TRINITY_DN236_c1_g1~~TRINITY_DN236_c1_g1_i1.p1  ORF type:complete len:641 (-),score=141.98 TRINITY_DN236_c1_g1_i1:1679-3481(-)